MKSLVLRVEFVAHSYQGVRLTLERKEDLDWPPAPGRLHQALMAAALNGVSEKNDRRLANEALDPLRWLERQPAPKIIASSLPEGSDFKTAPATRFRLAIPQNNRDNKSAGWKHSVVLADPPSRRAVPVLRNSFIVDYIWNFQSSAEEEAAEIHLAALVDLAAQIRYLGRAEDWTEVTIDIKEIDSARDGCENWRPTEGLSDVDLLVARRGTTDDLIWNFRTPVPPRTRKPPASRFLGSQGYTREAAEGLLPTHVGLFQLLAETDDPDETPLSCDAENAGLWRSRIRQRAVDLALDSRRWDYPELAQELITGHPPGRSSPTEQPHLAFVPLPSINARGTADGRVRRVALIGYARSDLQSQALDVYRWLSASLDGEQIEFGAAQYRLRLLDEPERDKVWSQLVRSSRVWHSITPVALARGFKIPKYTPDGRRALTSSERYVRRLSELTALMRSSLGHIGLPEDIVERCEITLTPSPLLLNTSRAERYRPPGESAVFTHARLRFCEPVRGPLIVGDRRYQGYGLFLSAVM